MDILLLILRLLLAILLYAFLATVLLMVWRDLRQATTTPKTSHRSGELVILQTTDEALETGTAFPLQPITSIGRAPSNTIIVSDTYASSQHALLTWREGQWWLEDQGSRNGTLLNDTRITVPTVVSAGDVIGIGRTQLKLELD
jgi:pSer/pThr/pTyr-binding forkhead associated (FHA) protein